MLRSFTLLAAVVLILGNLGAIEARTRYEEIEYAACQPQHIRPEVSIQHQPRPYRMPLLSCAGFCQTKSYPYGGCDCVTNKCVCADMNLNFCKFQELKPII